MRTLKLIMLLAISQVASSQPFFIDQEKDYTYELQEDGNWKSFLVTKTEERTIPCPKDVTFTPEEVRSMDLGHTVVKNHKSGGFFDFTPENLPNFACHLVTIKAYRIKNGFVDVAKNETLLKYLEDGSFASCIVLAIFILVATLLTALLNRKHLYGCSYLSYCF
ncbi:MAG: hypothetical protein R3B55_03525 [Candidatus Paceibacterota bacterium]